MTPIFLFREHFLKSHLIFAGLTLISLLPASASAVHTDTPPPSGSSDYAGDVKAALPSVIVGYQGWFDCPDDFEGNKNWRHWFRHPANEERFTVDMLPDLSELDLADQCDTGIKRADGQGTIKVFSSQNPSVVDMHVRWMAENGIQAIALQRFVSVLKDPVRLRRSDNVLAHIRNSAARHRVRYYMVYDVSSGSSETVIQDIWKDWQRLQQNLGITRDSAYLQYGGKPLIQLWGFGFTSRPGEPVAVRSFIEKLQRGDGNTLASAVVGGVPTGWRTLSGDSHTDPLWRDVYAQYDILSPWTVGRFKDEAGAKHFTETILKPDLKITQARKQAYLPVVFPGFSWANLMRVRGEQERSIPNQIPRKCGDFLRSQIRELKALGLSSIYAAMFDELDEGTALMPILANGQLGPLTSRMVYSSQDGCDLPKNGYLQILTK